MVECGVGIRIGVTTDIQHIVMPYFEACNFPMTMVDWFESRERDVWWSSKYDAMRHSSFSDTERVLHSDMCVLIGTEPIQKPIPLFSTIKELWKSQPIAFGSSILKDKRGKLSQLEERYLNRDFFDLDDWASIIDKANGTAEEQLAYWKQSNPIYKVGGATVGVSRIYLDDSEFWKKFDTKMRVARSDEAAWCLTAYEQDWKPSHYANLSPAYQWGKSRGVHIFDECTDVQTFYSQYVQ